MKLTAIFIFALLLSFNVLKAQEDQIKTEQSTKDTKGTETTPIETLETPVQVQDPTGEIKTSPPLTLTDQDQSREILERHNYWRSQLGIAPLTWSNDLAAYAQQWANELSSRGCNMEHRPGDGEFKQIYGENIYWASGANLTGKDAVESWANERNDYNNETQEGNGAVVGHYTQMIWENTTEVGCAMVQCSDGSVIWVCNYNPPGNYNGEKPWKKK